MTSIDNDIEALREAIDEASAHDLRELAKELCDKAEELEKDNSKLEDENDALEADMLEHKRSEHLDYQELAIKHQKLFTGDLSRLTHADRRELFEAIYESDHIALSRLESFI